MSRQRWRGVYGNYWTANVSTLIRSDCYDGVTVTGGAKGAFRMVRRELYVGS